LLPPVKTPEPTACVPRIVLPSPVVAFCPALRPIPMLLVPVVFADKAALPTATL
jgi:hypothetical protein